MKVPIVLLICVSFFAIPDLAAETVKIESSTPFIVANGQYIYPVNRVYTVTLEDTRILVQGQVYVPVEKHPTLLPEPNRDKDFFDWAIRTPEESAQALIDTGGTIEAARQLMAGFYQQFIESDTFSVVFKDDCYHLTYRGMEVYVPVPNQKREPKPDYQENVLVPAFKDLCYHLQVGNLILRGEGYRQVIQASELSKQLLQQLKDIPGKISKNACGEYQSVTLPSGTRLLPSAIDDLVKVNK